MGNRLAMGGFLIDEAEEVMKKNRPAREGIVNTMNWGKYGLPELSYDYDVLEPHISSRLLTIHHDKHHQGYVNGANALLDRLDSARDNDTKDPVPSQG